MMKYTFLGALLVTISCFGQNWKVSQGGNPMDGKHSFTQVSGTPSVFKERGTGKAYIPTLEIQAFANGEVVLKVSGIGIFKDRGKQLIWAIDSEPNNLYNVALYTNDNSNQVPATAFDDGYRNTTLTVKGFYFPKSEVAYFYPIEMLDKMTSANTLYLRVHSSEGDLDFSFSLKGAAAAINSMVSKAERDKKIAEIEEVRKPIVAKENAKNESKKLMYDQLNTQIDQLPFNSYQIKDMKNRLNKALEPDQDTGEMKQYVSILLVPDPSEGYFESTGNTMIYIVTADGEKKDIGYHSMDMKSEVFRELLQKMELEKQEKEAQQKSNQWRRGKN